MEDRKSSHSTGGSQLSGTGLKHPTARFVRLHDQRSVRREGPIERRSGDQTLGAGLLRQRKRQRKRSPVIAEKIEHGLRVARMRSSVFEKCLGIASKPIRLDVRGTEFRSEPITADPE